MCGSVSLIADEKHIYVFYILTYTPQVHIRLNIITYNACIYRDWFWKSTAREYGKQTLIM